MKTFLMLFPIFFLRNSPERLSIKMLFFIMNIAYTHKMNEKIQHPEKEQNIFFSIP